MQSSIPENWKSLLICCYFDRIKVSETKRHLLSSKSSKANMTNSLDTLKERETGSGLEYLAGRAPSGGRPAGYPVFFLYNWHCSASLSKGGLTPAHCAGFIWAASCAACRNLTWPPLLSPCPETFCLKLDVGFLRCERVYWVFVWRLTCLCAFNVDGGLEEFDFAKHKGDCLVNIR